MGRTSEPCLRFRLTSLLAVRWSDDNHRRHHGPLRDPKHSNLPRSAAQTARSCCRQGPRTKPVRLSPPRPWPVSTRHHFSKSHPLPLFRWHFPLLPSRKVQGLISETSRLRKTSQTLPRQWPFVFPIHPQGTFLKYLVIFAWERHAPHVERARFLTDPCRSGR